MLREDTSSNGALQYKRLTEAEMSSRGILGRLVGVCADFANPTRNGRKYSEQLWENVFSDPIMKEKIANHCVFGELCHPADREEIDMEKVAVCLAEQPVKSKDGTLKAVFDILDTPNGRILKTLCDYGAKVGISSRGSGDLYTDADGEEAVDPETYNCECFDVVLVPGVEKARLQYVHEALDKKRYNKTLKQRLDEQLQGASEEDRKVMKESLDNMFEDAYTRDELMDKFGTDDLDLINAGNEEDVTLADDQAPEEADMGSDLVPNDAEVEYDPKPTETEESLNESTARELTIDDIDPSTEPGLYNAMDYGAISLVYDNGKLNIKVVNDEALKEAGLSINDLQDELKTLQYSLSVADGVDEELESEDGWGDTVGDTLEPIFDDIERMIYEVRNGRRGSYADFGSELSGLINKLDELSNSMQDAASDLESQEDAINETNEELEQELSPEDSNYFKKELNTIMDSMLLLMKEAEHSLGEEDNFTRALYKAYDVLDNNYEPITEGKTFKSIDEAKKYIASLSESVNVTVDCNDDGTEFYVKESTNESCGDKELEECGSVDNVKDYDMGEFKEALQKVKQLEKDNLSLQEKLSVCNAKEVQLGEELKKYKASTASLSESAKKARALQESVASYKKELDEKNKLLESKNSTIESLNGATKATEELQSRIDKLEEELDVKKSELNESMQKLERYKKSLKDTRELYLEAKANSYGLDPETVKANLNESYKNKDIEKVCESLLEQKRNLSKLPFRLTEDVKISPKASKNEYIMGNNYNFFDDDNTDSMLKLINL